MRVSVDGRKHPSSVGEFTAAAGQWQYCNGFQFSGISFHISFTRRTHTQKKKMTQNLQGLRYHKKEQSVCLLCSLCVRIIGVPVTCRKTYSMKHVTSRFAAVVSKVYEKKKCWILFKQKQNTIK